MKKKLQSLQLKFRLIPACWLAAVVILLGQNCIPPGNFELNHTDLSTAGPKYFPNPIIAANLGSCQLVLQSAKLYVSLDVGEDYEFGKDPFSVTINAVHVRFLDPSANLLFEQTKTLSIDQNHPEVLWEISLPNNYIYYFTQQVEFNISGYSASPAFTYPKIRLKAHFELGDKFDILGSGLLLQPVSGSALVTDNPVQFTWQPTCTCVPNYEFQLLRLFNADAANTNEQIISAKVDWSKALSIETQGKDPALALKVVEGTGYYLWRVRPIGNYYAGGIANNANWGDWSDQTFWNSIAAGGGSISFTSISGLPPYAFFYQEIDADKNWIYSRTFSEAERKPGSNSQVKISEQITYANGLLQAEQNQQHMFSQNNVLVGETMYDFSGRPALSTLYAPVNKNSLSYVPDFAFHSGAPYRDDHFDNNGNYADPGSVDGGKLQSYYSDNNPDLLIPSAQGYPFSRTLYWADGTRRVRETSAPGEDLRLHPNGQPTHTTRYYYAGVADLELVRVFGDEAPISSSVGKMVAVDPDETTTVTYVDKNGQTIADCLSANQNSANHDPLPSRSAFSVIDTLLGSSSCGDHCLQTAKTYFFIEPTTLTIHYEIDTTQVALLCASFCKTCDYRIKIIVKRIDEPDALGFPLVVDDISLPPVDCIDGIAFAHDYSVPLQPGYYQVVKQITVDNVNPATINPPGNPYGDKYVEGVLSELKTKIEAQVTTDALWQTITTYLEGNQSEALYDYLETNYGLLPTDKTFSFQTACCSFTLPISRCAACPVQNNDFEAYYNSIYPIGSDLGDQSGTATLDYLGPFPYQPGQFNQMIVNMDTAGYDPQLLCDCWVTAVQAWQTFHDAGADTDFGLEGSPGLLDNFLTCAGRRLEGFTTATGFGAGDPPGYLSHAFAWFYYDPASPNTLCEKAWCDQLALPNPPTNYACTALGAIDWSTVNWSAEEWLNFYNCTLYADGSITPGSYAADVAAQIVDACNDACENRFGGFVEALKLLYVENGYHVQPACSLDPGDLNYDPACVPLTTLYCQAEKLVELCKQGCQPLSPLFNGSDLVGYGTDAEILALQQSMYYAFDLEFAASGTPSCPLDFTSTASLPVSPVTSIEFAGWVADYLNGQLADFINNSVEGALFNVTEALNDFSPGLGTNCPAIGVTGQMIPTLNGGHFGLIGCDLFFIREGLPTPICVNLCNQYTPFRCDDICLKWIPAIPPTPDHVFEYIPCQQQASQYGLNVLQGQFQSCVTGKVENYRQKYFSTCLDPALIKDLCSVGYELGYYHYTLYYHDRAGNLVQTVPPAGVDETHISRLQHAPEHDMRTRYDYNSLQQLIWQFTPDGGETEFIYDQKGQLRFSQNARQKPLHEFAYTRYDYLGRVVEVGKSGLGTLSWSDLHLHVENANFPDAIYGLSERIFTVYSKPYAGVIIGGRTQRFLQNRVSYTYTDDDGDPGTLTDRRATYYSYDPHGNVEWVVQDVMPELQQSSPELRQFVMEYEHDLISNKVLRLNFMPGRADQFFTAYSYDDDNRITEVRTSRDGKIWDRDARYDYYLHGPLRRTLTGEDEMQGTDYVYTLQGWLKSINHPTLDAAKDPGLDGFGGSKVAKDVFASGLGYFQGDFKHTGSQFEGEQNFTGNFGFVRNLYNGNISTWVNNSAVNPALAPDYKHPGLTGRRFKYDELNRLTDSDFSYFDGNWKTTPEYDSYYSYDPNGNFQTLDRFAHYKNFFLWFQAKHMDCLRYHYQPGTNRLSSVTDGFIFPNLYSEDLDNTSNYVYDPTGNLTEDPNNGISKIEWNLLGKVRRVTKTDNTVIDFAYDAAGNRILKKVAPAGGQPEFTWYALDAGGNMLATYTRNDGGMGAYTILQQETMLYGSQRLGVWNTAQHVFGVTVSGGGYSEFYNNAPAAGFYLRQVAQKAYELNDHLGDVRMTVSDVKLPGAGFFRADVLSGSDYYPFGMGMVGRAFEAGGFRFGFNGKENDNEVKGKGNYQDYGMRSYDSRLGRFFSVDPLNRTYPELSSYQFASNSPIENIDLDGAEAYSIRQRLETTMQGKSLLLLNDFAANFVSSLVTVSSVIGIPIINTGNRFLHGDVSEGPGPERYRIFKDAVYKVTPDWNITTLKGVGGGEEVSIESAKEIMKSTIDVVALPFSPEGNFIIKTIKKSSITAPLKKAIDVIPDKKNNSSSKNSTSQPASLIESTGSGVIDGIYFEKNKYSDGSMQYNKVINFNQKIESNKEEYEKHQAKFEKSLNENKK